MTAGNPESPDARALADDPGIRLNRLPARSYPLRVLGMGLAALPLGAVLRENGGPGWAWTWLVLSCLAWPHLARLHARLARDPVRAELRNFVVDSFIAASWVPLMHFNLLPSVVLVSVVFADKLNTGIRGLWLRSLPGMAIGFIGAGLLSGFVMHPATSMTVVVASLPILVVHTLVVAWSTHRLVRRVQLQNLRLRELNRVDALTGLASRGHWQAESVRLLESHRRDGHGAALLLLDVDHFKAINDRHGHTVGDDVLRGIANLINAHLPVGGCAGRLGGDEFAVVVPVSLDAATEMAEKLRRQVEALHFSHAPSLRCSLSIGLAPAPQADLGLREWMELADGALYQAKRDGRNRIVRPDAASLP